MAVLDDCKVLLGVTDTSKDAVLNLYIRRANTLINTYLNVSAPVDTSADYPDAVIEYVTECLQRQGNEGVKQYMQGSRQGTYETGLSDEVKALLPPPFVRMYGGATDEMQ